SSWPPTSITTSPPLPPLPPSGPPRGTSSSRRKVSAPAPPSPPLTKIFARSVNTRRDYADASACRPVGLADAAGRGRLLAARLGQHRDALAVVAGSLEPNHAVDQGEQGVGARGAAGGAERDGRRGVGTAGAP